MVSARLYFEPLDLLIITRTAIETITYPLIRTIQKGITQKLSYWAFSLAAIMPTTPKVKIIASPRIEQTIALLESYQGTITLRCVCVSRRCAIISIQCFRASLSARFLTSSHRLSISSRGNEFRLLSFCKSVFSISLKRFSNFLVAARSAVSG